MTLTQCLRSLPDDEALVVADSAARAGELAMLARLGATSSGRGAARIRGKVAEARAEAANPFESVLRSIANGVDGLRVEPQRLPLHGPLPVHRHLVAEDPGGDPGLPTHPLPRGAATAELHPRSSTADHPVRPFYLNTAIITLAAMVGAVITAASAYGFARFRWPGRDFLFMVLLSTLVLPEEVVIIPKFLMFDFVPRALFGSTLIDTCWPLIVPSWFGGGAFYIFLLRQFFLQIPRELDEAAKIDGANSFQILWPASCCRWPARRWRRWRSSRSSATGTTSSSR